MTIYDFGVETPDGVSQGSMENQPTLPAPGDVLELFPPQGGAASYWQVRRRRFTNGGCVVVIVDPLS
jgi:hypothetical protein